MRTRNLILLTVAAALAVPATASADAEHVVTRGETLTSIAAADGLSVSSLAAANGLSSQTELTTGTVLQIPPRGAAATAPGPTAGAPASAPVAVAGGGYVVQPGDTLTGIAARYGISVDALAAENGMSLDNVLLAGRTLSISGVPAVATATVATPSAAPEVQPTSEYVTASDVGAIASQLGVSPSLAEAVADQESGFNNAEVSDTGATGVMQIEPGTWSDLASLGGATLSPDSATDNVTAGIEYLRSLLDATGGDETTALGAYYQGLTSVRERGLYRSTERYVRDVEALQSRF
jgi:soluble lytic murein transglycosylase-like protein